MQPYQNYYPTMNPYQQISNFNQYQPQVDRFSPQQQRAIPGMVVTDFATITANDVPMDGNCATFIKSDFSEIQLRAWQPDGTIATKRFKQVLETPIENSALNDEKSFYDDFRQFKEDIFERLDKLDKSKTTSRPKKEVDADA